MLRLFRRQCVRSYSTFPSLPPLPAASEWRKDNQQLSRRPRVTLSNPETGTRLTQAFFSSEDETPAGKGKVVIEAFAGPGVLTRALLQLPPSKLRKLIVLEDNPKFYQHLKELEAFDPRVKALLLNAHDWDSYDKIKEEGLLDDVESQDWQNESELEFVATLPHSVIGEQLMAQLLRTIPERSWLFAYGRMRMNMIIPDNLYNRIDAPLGKPRRCKLSVIAEATSSFRRPLPPADLRPYNDHFWPPPSIPRTSMPDTRKPGHPMVAVTFEPLKEQIIHRGMLDKWDYCLRRLFVLKSYELRKALPSLAAGANNLVQYLQGPDAPPEDRVDLKERINGLTVNDWENIVKAFDKWPFAPHMLYIRDSLRDERNF